MRTGSPRRIRVGTQNIQDNPDLAPAKAIECAALMRPLVGVCGFQEVWGDDDRAQLATGLGHEFTINDFGHGIPIAFRHRYWRPAPPTMLRGLDREGYVMGHHGHARNMHHPELANTPERGYQFQALRRLDATLMPFFVFNTHPINGGWSTAGQIGDQDPDGPGPLESDRRTKWHQVVDPMMSHIEHVNALGFSAFAVGDFNRRIIPKMLPNERCLVDGGLDKIYFYPAKRGTGFLVKEARRVPTPSDHDGRTVEGTLWNKGA